MYYLKSEKLGECTTLLHNVFHLWGINFTVINFSGIYTHPLLLFGTDSNSKHTYAYLIYNGSTHNTGTADWGGGLCLYFFSLLPIL